MIILSKNELAFPDPQIYHTDSGIIALGGDLSPERLLFAYSIGIFPWYNPGEEILWWCPDPRFVLFPENLRISKSMRKIMERGTFTFTENRNFREVITACMNIERPGQDGTWLSDELIESMMVLHRQGIARSVEVWKDEKLVGGLYGLKIGDTFFGESMFALESNASKAGFIHFVTKHASELKLIDCQVHTDHLESLGAAFIPKKEFLTLIRTQT